MQNNNALDRIFAALQFKITVSAVDFLIFTSVCYLLNPGKAKKRS